MYTYCILLCLSRQKCEQVVPAHIHAAFHKSLFQSYTKAQLNQIFWQCFYKLWLFYWNFDDFHIKNDLLTPRDIPDLFIWKPVASVASREKNFLQINSWYLKFQEGNLFEKTKKYFSKMAKLFVYGVNARCPRDVLEGEFARCGEVTDVYITEKVRLFSPLLFNILTVKIRLKYDLSVLCDCFHFRRVVVRCTIKILAKQSRIYLDW